MAYIGNAPYQGSLTGTNIVDGTIDTADLKDGSITTTKLETLSGLIGGSYGSASAIPQITVDTKGRITSISTNNVSIPSGTLTFSGDVTGSGNTGSTTTLTLSSTGITAGQYGDSLKTLVLNADTKGRITGISAVNINVSSILGYTPESSANKAVANGYASLDGSGKVPASQLPSYVDDVLEYANAGARPATGETGKLYLTLDNNKVYRWSGSTYVEIVASPSSTDSVTEGTTNLYYTTTRANNDFDTRLATKSTTNLTEGTNLYYTTSRANNDFDTRLATKSTSNLTEGTNLYYTNARVDTRIAATSINALSDVDTATSAPTSGQGLIWNSTTSQWVPGNVAANVTGSTTRTLTSFTATSNQSVFTINGGYTPGYVDVYQNGIKLIITEDFTASNGINVTLTQAATLGDSVEVVAYQLATVVSTAGPKAGGGIIVNKTVIDENYTFPSNHNGFSIGPVVVASGVTVSIPSGQRWLVV